MKSRRPTARARRNEAAAAVEQLIAFLEATDPDPDAEPSLAFSSGGYRPEEQVQEGFGYSMNADAGWDREDDHDGAEPHEDSEPSLGWTSTTDQTAPAWTGQLPGCRRPGGGRWAGEEEAPRVEDGESGGGRCWGFGVKTYRRSLTPSPLGRR